jgi:hypothetical protein
MQGTQGATMWQREAIAMHDAGIAMREIALTLDAVSDVRVDLLGAADRWLQCARLRGVRHSPAANADRPRSVQAL